MDFKTIQFLKGKVVTVVLVFCILSFGGILFTFIKSLKIRPGTPFTGGIFKKI